MSVRNANIFSLPHHLAACSVRISHEIHTASNGSVYALSADAVDGCNSGFSVGGRCGYADGCGSVLVCYARSDGHGRRVVGIGEPRIGAETVVVFVRIFH